MRSSFIIPSIVLILLLTAWGAAAAETQAGQEQLSSMPAGTADPRTFYQIPTGSDPVAGTERLYFAPGNLYPPYAADPFRVGFGFEPVHVSKLRIPDTSKTRVSLRAGGLLTVLRSEKEGRPDVGWQISLLGGFNDQNDVINSLDNIGWDGRYGILFMTAPRPGLAFKFGLLHVSSHVGDEYMERTGRKRIGYTRQELAIGASWYATDRWRLYAETGKALSTTNRDQDPWRGQFGLEYESAPVLWRRRAAWYAAVDVQAMQERDWRCDISFQTGFLVRATGRTWRLGGAWYNGRPMIGEFFQYTERYLSVGLWIDI